MEFGIPGDRGENVRKIRGGRAHHGNGRNDAIVFEHPLISPINGSCGADDLGVREGISLPPGRVMQ